MKKENPALTQPPPADKDVLAAESPEAARLTDAGVSDSAVLPDTQAEPLGEATGAGEPPADAPASPASESTGEGGKPPTGEIPPGAPGRKGSAVPLVIAIIALIVSAVLGWQVYELRQLAGDTRQEVAQRLSGSETAVAEVRALNRQQHDSITALQGRFGALEAQIAATEGQAAALEALYQEYSRSRSDQVLAEVEQAINIAAQQLQLAGNFEAALIALQGAEARLSLPEQGHLQPLRRALIMDIDALRAHPQVDVSGLALRLEIVLERIDRLPLAHEVALAEATAERERIVAEGDAEDASVLVRTLGFVKALGIDIWNEVKGMVRLERMDQSDPVLLAPAQSTYLRENVKIRLLTARLALLARDGRTYAADLAQAREWIERFFDTRDEQVQGVVADLAELAQTPVKAEQPSLKETFTALRLLQARPPGRSASGESSQAPDGTR